MILASVLGTLTGLVGSVGNKLLSIRELKVKNEHEVNMVKAESDAIKAEAEANIRITETQIAGELSISEQNSFDISQQVGNKANISSEIILSMIDSKNWVMKLLGGFLAFLLGIIDVVRTSIRPAITITLMLLTAYMYFNSWEIIQKSEIKVIDIITLVESVNYLTFTVVGWWFGERGLANKVLHSTNK